jgi:hypothetical protein
VSTHASIGKWSAGLAVAAAVVGAGVYLVRQRTPPPPATAPAPVASATAPAHYPIAQARSGPAAASTAPLPALDASDAAVAEALSALAGGHGLRGLLVDGNLIPRIVATVDALPRHDLGNNILPAHTPKGAFITEDVAGRTVTGEANYARYAPYMQVVSSVDSSALVDWYVRNYPLFQQAYRELGYPTAYFNDRLVVAIDDMLAAPDLSATPALVKQGANYVYQDPALEALSVGQKLLLRTGPANEAAIKAKLRAIRADLVGRPPAARQTGPGEGDSHP